MTAVVERYEPYVAAFEALRRDPAFGSSAQRAGREAAFQRFLDRGFPTVREEEWRFTNVAPIASASFARAAAAQADRAALEPFLFAGCFQVVVVNGRVSRALSSPLADAPAGVAIELGADEAAPAEPAASGAFADLNAAFCEEAVTIRVAPKAVVETPIHVLAFAVTGPVPPLVAPRLEVRVGEGAQVSVVESYASAGPALTTAMTHFRLAPGAVVNHVKIQREAPAAFHVAMQIGRLARASTLVSRSMTFGGRIARNDVIAVLEGEGAECTLHGLYVGTGDSLIDNHTTIDHAQPHCPSHEIYKGILAGRARAVFNGKIVVRPDAQKTDAKQTNKALLLTDDAQINTKPQLEIFADDVKCTHGAAIGQLDEDAMFYLRARGIAESDARNVLIHAFAGEILSGVPLPAVRERLERTMEERLRLNH